jgi:glucosamine-6-phosphate isomerase
MKINIQETYEGMSAATAAFIVSKVNQKPASLLCIASGDSPTGTIQNLLDAVNEKKLDLDKCTFVGLDEWVGMDEFDAGGCKHYVYSKFFNPLSIPPERIAFFDAKAADLGRECKKVDDYIFKHGPIDVIVVGVGLNGHVGLNEPGSSPESYCHVVPLAESTIQTARKYFSSETNLEKGITLGLKHMLDAKTVIVIASGKKKASIIQKIIEGEISTQVPGSILQKHPDCYFFLDKEAAAELKIN